jgi:hypothetical protein
LSIRQERIDKKCRTSSGRKTFVVKPIRLDTASIYECTSVFLKTLSTARGSLQMFCNGAPVPCTFPAGSLLGYAGKRPRKLLLYLVISRSGARIYEPKCGFALHSRAEQGKRAISNAAPPAMKFGGLKKTRRSGASSKWYCWAIAQRRRANCRRGESLLALSEYRTHPENPRNRGILAW